MPWRCVTSPWPAGRWTRSWSTTQPITCSTDKGSPYIETDPPHPLGAYAVSKLAGELYAQAYLDNPLDHPHVRRFRSRGMFTPRGNFVELMLRLAQGDNPIRVVQDHVASPTYAPAMAARTADMVEKGHRRRVPHGRRRADLLVRIRAR